MNIKKIASIASVIIVCAVTAAAWQIHLYNQDVRRTLEAENVNLLAAVHRTEALAARHEQAILALELRLQGLTNQPAGAAKTGNG